MKDVEKLGKEPTRANRQCKYPERVCTLCLQGIPAVAGMEWVRAGGWVRGRWPRGDSTL